MNETYYIYMLRCSDGSIYTGIAKDLERRMGEHFGRTAQCAKYTESHPPIRLEQAWKTDSRSHAARLEYRIKQLRKLQKELLVRQPERLEEILGLENNNVYETVIKCT